MNQNADQSVTGKQIEENEKRLRALLLATSEVVYRMSPDWEILYTLDGQGFLAELEKPTTDWIRKYTYPEDIPLVKATIDKAIREKSVFELEHRIQRSDGSIGWTFSRAVPILNEAGEITEWFGAASDITSRKSAEEMVNITRQAQESSKRLYEAITGNTPDLMYVFSLDYRFIYANAALLAMWGKTESEAMGCGLLELGYEPWHAEMHEREIDQVAATKAMIRGDVSFPHATLGKRIYDYIFSPVLNENGEVVAVAGTTRDISDIKAAEAALKESGERLELQVQERTKELKRSNDDLMQFAHVASHDLKEPMRKIKTFAGMLGAEIKDASSGNASLYLEKIVNAADRMNTMIEGVLNFSTLSNLNQKMEQVNLNELIQSIENDLEVPIHQKKAVFNYKELPVVYGAPVLMYQLFYNLINNSLKFTSEGVTPVISIQAEKITLEAKNYWKIQLQDNGIGFPQKFSDQIFETFTRLNSKDAFEGTGLGLALCKRIVERHDGSISAVSEPGQGARFDILLPIPATSY